MPWLLNLIFKDLGIFFFSIWERAPHIAIETGTCTTYSILTAGGVGCKPSLSHFFMIVPCSMSSHPSLKELNLFVSNYFVSISDPFMRWDYGWIHLLSITCTLMSTVQLLLKAAVTYIWCLRAVLFPVVKKNWDSIAGKSKYRCYCQNCLQQF